MKRAIELTIHHERRSPGLELTNASLSGASSRFGDLDSRWVQVKVLGERYEDVQLTQIQNGNSHAGSDCAILPL